MKLFDIISVSWSILLVLIYLVAGLDINLVPFSCMYLLYINTWMLILSRKNMMMLLISFIFLFCSYSIIYANFSGNINNMFTDIIQAKTFTISFNILTLFHALLALFVRWAKIQSLEKINIFVDTYNANFRIILITACCLVPIFFLGFKITGLTGDRGEGSPLYEYSVILFSVLFFFSGQKKKYIILGILLLLPYVLQNFLFGGRIEGVQFILCAYIMLYMYKIEVNKIIPFILVGFFVLSLIGAVRGELLLGSYDVESIFSALFKGGFALDTAYSAYFTSETFVYVYDKMTTADIAYYLTEFIKSIFLGNSHCPDSVLGSVTYEYVSHWFGGILPFYFYFYFGPIGIFLAAFFVALYLNMIIKVKSTSSGYTKIIVVWTVCTVFRWYLYTPLVLLRGVLITLVVFIIFKLIDSILRKKPINA